MAPQQDEVGRASGFTIDEEDGRFRWSAFGPHGTRPGEAATRAEAERAAREAERELTELPPPPRSS